MYIEKRSGQREKFDIKRVENSLEKSGVSYDLIKNITSMIKNNPPKSTQELHHLIVTYLNKEHHSSFAARYNLKTALFDLGPDGFFFEQFIALILREMGFKVQTNVTIPGACVEHEVDIIGYNNTISYFIECKFHNQQGTKSDIKVPLYVQARFEDIQEFHKKETFHKKEHLPWCVTNTEFSSQAIAYASCKKMRMLDWSYPEKENLAYLVDYYGLHPITALTTLSHEQKQSLIKKGLLLCRDAEKFYYAFKEVGFSDHDAQRLIDQAGAVTKIERDAKQ